MFLDLHEIIEVPGGRVPFRCELDRERLAFPALVRFDGPVTASGEVKNTAGILELTAIVEADMTVRCDRCTAEFSQKRSVPVEATLKADPDEDDYDELFPLDGDGVDVSDVLETCFILNMEQKFLCREDCKGLCGTCGKNLNDGPCGCRKQTDPRMAALAQLLDDIQEV
ncbi:MAG: YceD family protein [Oscillospiraceae bacterium]